MTLTYTDETPAAQDDAVYTPVYARGRKRSAKKIRTWMILAPVAGIVLLGGVTIMLVNGGEAVAPSTENQSTASTVPVNAGSGPLDSDISRWPLTAAATPAPVAILAPSATEAASVQSAAPAGRSSPARRVAAPAVAEPASVVEEASPVVEEAPIGSTGVRAYNAEATTPTTTLDSTVTPSVTTVAPPVPAISVQPLN